jgi:hypothetical protein
MGAGACSALIADAADDPGPADAMGWGRAVVIPAMGSVLVAGHSPLGAFVLRAAHAGSVPLAGATPLDCEEAADIVDVDEACEESDELEFDRWALFRGIKAPLGVPPSALHGCRLRFWYPGSATAVIGEVVVGVGLGKERRAVQGHFSWDSRPLRSSSLTTAWQPQGKQNTAATLNGLIRNACVAG